MSRAKFRVCEFISLASRLSRIIPFVKILLTVQQLLAKYTRFENAIATIAIGNELAIKFAILETIRRRSSASGTLRVVPTRNWKIRHAVSALRHGGGSILTH